MHPSRDGDRVKWTNGLDETERKKERKHQFDLIGVNSILY